jgi:hypothetical protein
MISLFCTLLFTVHPIQTQAVSFISQRGSVLAAFFYLLSLLFFLLARKKKSPVYFVGMLLTALGAWLSKENTYTLPLGVLLVEWFQRSKTDTKISSVKAVIPIIVLFILFVSIHRLIPQKSNLGLNTLVTMTQSGHDPRVTRGEYLSTQPLVIMTYLRLLFFPVNQNIDYDFPVQSTLFTVPTFLSLAVILALIICSIMLWKYNRLISFGIAFFFITLLIEASVIPIADVIAEHRLYLPSVGFFLAFVAAVFEISKRITLRVKKNGTFLKAAQTGIFSLILASFLYATPARNKAWANELSLYRDIVSKSPQKAKPIGNYGSALLKAGREEEALKYLMSSLDLDARNSFVYNNIGIIYERQSKRDLAIEYYQKSLAIEPDYPNARNNLAALYYHAGRYEDAKKEYEVLLVQHPFDADGNNGLGVILFQMGEKEEGIKHVEIALSADPHNTRAKKNLEMMKKMLQSP